MLIKSDLLLSCPIYLLIICQLDSVFVLEAKEEKNGNFKNLIRFKREPQWTGNNQFRQQQQGQGGLHRSFSTSDLDQLGGRRPYRPHHNGGNSPESQSCNLNYDFDYFVLAIQWPSSFCLEKQECNLQIARQKKWLIHGLWPNRRRKSLSRNQRDVNNQTKVDTGGTNKQNLKSHHNQVEFCCGPRYNSSLFTGPIYRELLDKWPTLHPNGRHHSFWQHEWQKHGTCARQVRPLQTQLKYFETILELYNRFNLSTVPFQNGRSYKIQDVHRYIEPRVGNFKVRLECSLVDVKSNITGGFSGSSNQDQDQQQQQTLTRPTNNDNNQSQQVSILSEGHICLNKQLQPIDCPHNDDYQCKRFILFP